MAGLEALKAAAAAGRIGRGEAAGRAIDAVAAAETPESLLDDLLAIARLPFAGADAPRPLAETDRRRLLAALAGGGGALPGSTLLALLAAVEGIAGAPAVGLAAAIRAVLPALAGGKAPLAAGDGEALAGRLARAGWLPLADPEPVRDALLEALALDVPSHQVRALVLLAGLGVAAAPETVAAAAERIAIPLLVAAFESGRLDAALLLESDILTRHARQEEAKAAYEAIIGRWQPAAAAAGRRLAANLGAAPPAKAPNGPPHVLFLLPSAARLAHVDVLLTFLDGLRRLAAPPVRPSVGIVSGPMDADLAARLDALGVPWIAPGAQDAATATGPLAGLLAIRRHVAEAGIAATVHVSAPQFMAFATALRLAPVQIWWSMKFPLCCFPDLDGRVGFDSLTGSIEEIDGLAWRFGPISMPPTPPRPGLADDVARARAPFARYGLVLGTVAREEKVRVPAYLAAVAEILKHRPDACFLWTGRTAPEDVQAHFAREGVAERCHFLGWVDPETYVRVFDLFLDTFELSGTVPIQAIQAGTPVLARAGTRSGVLSQYLADALAAEPEAVRTLFAGLGELPGAIVAESAEAYVDLALRLADDAAFRARYSEATAAFVTRTFADPARMAAIHAGHFRAVVEGVG